MDIKKYNVYITQDKTGKAVRLASQSISERKLDERIMTICNRIDINNYSVRWAIVGSDEDKKFAEDLE